MFKPTSFACVCACGHVQSLSCMTLCDSLDYSPPGSVQWVAISFCRGSSWPRNQTYLYCIGRQIRYRWATWEVVLHELSMLCLCFQIHLSLHSLNTGLWHWPTGIGALPSIQWGLANGDVLPEMGGMRREKEGWGFCFSSFPAKPGFSLSSCPPALGPGLW